MKKRTVLVGLDPGLDNFGIAVSSNRSINHLETTTYEIFMRRINDLGAVSTGAFLDQIAVVCEDPNMSAPVYGAAEAIKNAIKRYGIDSSKTKSVIDTQLHIAQAVGMNKLVARLAINELRSYGVPVATISPTERDKAKPTVRGKEILYYSMPTKTNRAQFEVLTGISKKTKTSEHARDAATLILGRTTTWAIAKTKMR